jgi:cubilin
MPEGTFSSPGYPGNYPNNSMECSWLIRVPNRRAVILRFKTFDIPASDACIGDSVSLYSGDSKAAAQIGRYCGEVCIMLNSYKSMVKSNVVI